MLEEILRELNSTKEPVTVGELAKRLGVEEGALTGMLDFLERKGRLSVHRPVDCVERGLTRCTGCAYRGGCPSGRERKAGSSSKRKEA